MKYLIDVTHILGWKGNLTGIERVEYNLIKHYFENTDAEFIVWEQDASFKIMERNQVRDSILNRSSKKEIKNENSAPAKGRLKSIRNKLKKKQGSQILLPEGNIIILAGLWDNNGYIKSVIEIANNHRLIHVVYDMIPLVQRGFVVDYLPRVFENYMFSILPLCTGIMAISEVTASDTRTILSQHSLAVPMVKAFRLGDDIVRAKLAERPDGIANDFILSTGTIEARKNHALLYYVYKKLLAQGVKLPQLVIVGKRGWLTENIQYIIEHDTEIKGNLVIMDKITDSEMRWLYENCLFSVFPSFYEGWGLPVAESLGYGKVTLASSASSIKEAGQNSADYFSPFSTDELESLIKNYLDPKKCASRAAQIQKNYKLTKWQDASSHFALKVDEIINRA